MSITNEQREALIAAAANAVLDVIENDEEDLVGNFDRAYDRGDEYGMTSAIDDVVQGVDLSFAEILDYDEDDEDEIDEAWTDILSEAAEAALRLSKVVRKVEVASASEVAARVTERLNSFAK